MAVSTLRTLGFWMYAALFFTVQIRKIFQEIETNAQMFPKIKMPNPKEKSVGTNAGKKATA
jgi:hypothetical protein